MLAWVAVWALWTTPTALAWTDAQVQTARVRVEVDPQAQATVQVELRVEVRAGWLEGLEVAGFDDALRLDDESVRFEGTEEEGSFHPRVRRRDDGRIQFRFERRHAPRRGAYRVLFSYVSDLTSVLRPVAEDESHLHVEWTLPGWRSGLDGVEIALVLPGDAIFGADESERATVQRDRTTIGGQTQLAWRRAHLPRTLPWRVTAAVSRSAMDPQVVTAATVPALATPAEQDAEPLEPVVGAPTREATASATRPLAFGALFVFCGLLLLAFRAEAIRLRASPRGLLPGPLWIRITMLAAACAVGAWAVATAWIWGAATAATLCMVMKETAPLAPKLGRWAALDAEDVDRLRREAILERVRPLSWFDPSRAAGVAVWVAGAIAIRAWLSAGAALEDLLPCVAAAAAASLTCGWSRLPKSVAEKTQRLLEWQKQQPSLRLVGHTSSGTSVTLQDIRLRAPLDCVREGLLRLDLVVARSAPMGLVVTRTGSDAEHALSEAAGTSAPDPIVGPGGRIARTALLADSRAAADHIAAWMRVLEVPLEAARTQPAEAPGPSVDAGRRRPGLESFQERA